MSTGTTVDTELFMAHGDGNDPVTPYEGALALQDIYNSVNIHNELGRWKATDTVLGMLWLMEKAV